MKYPRFPKPPSPAENKSEPRKLSEAGISARDKQADDIDRRLQSVIGAVDKIASAIENAITQGARGAIKAGAKVSSSTLGILHKTLDKYGSADSKLTHSISVGARVAAKQADHIAEVSNQINLSRREVLAGLAGAAIATRSDTYHKDELPESLPEVELSGRSQSEIEQEVMNQLFPWRENISQHFYFDNPEIDWETPTPDGNYSRAERQQLTRELENGETIFTDRGQSFYLIEQGDSLSGIIAKLSKYREFDYLKTQNGRDINFINTPANSIIAGKWLPIPLNPENRIVQDDQLFGFVADAVVELLYRSNFYQQQLMELIKSNPAILDEILKSLFAIGRTESGGGGPAGTSAIHRYETRYKSYSYSHFHILMRDQGLLARKRLNLSEGQLAHPKNGAKLCLAFIIEKAHERLSRIFPVNNSNIQSFSSFYNGSGYRANKYDEKINSQLDLANKKLKKLMTPEPEEDSDSKNDSTLTSN